MTKRDERKAAFRSIPRPVRPSWNRWKDICRPFSNPFTAANMIIIRESVIMERKLREKKS